MAAALKPILRASVNAVRGGDDRVTAIPTRAAKDGNATHILRELAAAQPKLGGEGALIEQRPGFARHTAHDEDGF